MYSFIPFHQWCYIPWPPSEDAFVLLALLLVALILVFLSYLTYPTGRRLSVLSLFLLFSPLASYYESDVWLTVHRNSVWIRKTN